MTGGEIKITVGWPAAGKSSHIEALKKQGWHNINRDDLKCSIDAAHDKIEPMLDIYKKVVLDNTYLTLEHRAAVVKIAKKLGAKISVLWMGTTFEQAQFNACWRIEHGGRNIPAPAMYAAKNEFVPPTTFEGFDSIEIVDFVRVMPKEYTNKALILDYDGTLRVTKSGAKYPSHPDDVQVLPGVAKKLREYKDQGYLLLGASNQSFVGKGTLPESVCIDCFEKANKLLDLDIDYLFCPDSAFPIKSYFRKPLPGMGVKHIFKYKLDPKQCIMVGDATSDKTFAFRSEFQFIHADKFVSEVDRWSNTMSKDEADAKFKKPTKKKKEKIT